MIEKRCLRLGDLMQPLWVVAVSISFLALTLPETLIAAEHQGGQALVDFGKAPSFETLGNGAKAAVVDGALRVTFVADGSGVELKAPKRGWDLSKSVTVLLDVKNTGKKPVALHGMLNGNRWIDGFAALGEGERGRLGIVIKRKACTDARSKYFEAMNGWPGGFVWLWHEVNAARVGRIVVKGVDGSAGGQIEIRNVRASGSYAAPSEVDLKGKFFPFVDGFGQYKHASWPGKTKTEEDLAKQKESEDADLTKTPGPGKWNAYGGWATGPKLKATGHFRTQKHGGKWWLVDPEGRLFWSHGITCVRLGMNTRVKGREHYFEHKPREFMQGKNCDFGALNLSRKYGADWKVLARARAHARLRSWGMNTLANWSASDVYMMQKTPYVVAVHYGCPQIGTKFPDVNRPEFRNSLRKRLEMEKGKTTEDPWCIGYFINNELRWPKENRSALAEKYYKACREELKRVAPHKLYLGSRLHGHLDPNGDKRDVILAAAKYCDVVGINRYRFSPSDLKMAEGVDVPLMIGEFHWGALDRGLLHTGLRSVADQQQRGAAYVHYVTQALKHPHIVGTHWFQYQDQMVTGRGDGENYQIGFIDICDKPYAETVDPCREVGYRMYEIRAGK